MVLGHTDAVPRGVRNQFSSRRVVATLGVTTACVITLAACGGGDKQASASSAKPRAVSTTANAVSLSGRWPLTGETLPGALPDHPVYVVKVDNTPASAPQLGLGSADLVVEELVEGGLTRLAAFYYQDIPERVGPVRSMRASDIGIVKPVSATLIASGGARPTVARLAGSNVSTLIEGSSGFYRADARTSPYNLFMSLSEVADKPTGAWQAPTASYLPFGSADDFAGDIQVKTLAATFSGGRTTKWRFTGEGWERLGSFAEPGDDFVADNVLLLKVDVGDAGYLDPAGNPVPETRFYGTGQAVLVHGAEAVKCSWSKQDKGSPLELTTAAGRSVPVPAGHTWIELVPADTGNVTLGD